MTPRLAPAHLALTLFVVVLFGFAFVPIKVAVVEIPPFMLAALRFLLAALAAFFVRRPDMPWTGIAAYGIAIGVVQFGLLFLGIKLGMPAGLSSLVIQVQVFFTIGLAVAFAGDRFARWNALGALVAAAGIAVLGIYKAAGGESGPLAGFLAVIGAAAAWSVGNLIAKRAGADHDVDGFALVVWSSLAAPLPLLAMSLAFEGGVDALRAVAHASWLAWACVVFMAYGATALGFGLWNRLLHLYPTPLIAPFALLIPIAGLASGALFLGERLAAAQVAGAALVLAGLVVNVAGPRLTRASPAERA